ncbi:hypothetical protein vBSdyM006_086 [Shigella phage vB_SdyM_006]|nr:hypothetical protein vBSdyM006_086 [Shigella phage vB_SdyM_006]
MTIDMLSKKTLRNMSALELGIHIREFKPCLKMAELEFDKTQSHADYLQYKKLLNYFSEVKMIYKFKIISH